MTANHEPVTIWTVGHSTLPIVAFRDLLLANGVTVIADVRRFPMSRRHPQFNRAALADALAASGIRYEPFLELGGRRPPRPNSVNTAWRNPSFRGFADYADTPPFQEALSRLMDLAARASTALMCAEALWWRCHRALIADHVSVAGLLVRHIAGRGSTVTHSLTSAARLVDGRLTYAGEPIGRL